MWIVRGIRATARAAPRSDGSQDISSSQAPLGDPSGLLAYAYTDLPSATWTTDQVLALQVYMTKAAVTSANELSPKTELPYDPKPRSSRTPLTATSLFVALSWHRKVIMEVRQDQTLIVPADYVSYESSYAVINTTISSRLNARYVFVWDSSNTQAGAQNHQCIPIFTLRLSLQLKNTFATIPSRKIVDIHDNTSLNRVHPSIEPA